MLNQELVEGNWYRTKVGLAQLIKKEEGWNPHTVRRPFYNSNAYTSKPLLNGYRVQTDKIGEWQFLKITSRSFHKIAESPIPQRGTIEWEVLQKTLYENITAEFHAAYTDNVREEISKLLSGLMLDNIWSVGYVGNSWPRDALHFKNEETINRFYSILKYISSNPELLMKIFLEIENEPEPVPAYKEIDLYK